MDDKKACAVYKKKKEYKIITSYQLEVGRYVSRPPIFILPISVDIESLKNCIFQSLNASKKITYDDYYSGISSKDLLKEMKEASFTKLYKNSTSCMVYLKDEMIEIVPYKCEDPKEGLYEV